MFGSYNKDKPPNQSMQKLPKRPRKLDVFDYSYESPPPIYTYFSKLPYHIALLTISFYFETTLGRFYRLFEFSSTGEIHRIDLSNNVKKISLSEFIRVFYGYFKHDVCHKAFLIFPSVYCRGDVGRCLRVRNFKRIVASDLISLESYDQTFPKVNQLVLVNVSRFDSTLLQNLLNRFKQVPNMIRIGKISQFSTDNIELFSKIRNVKLFDSNVDDTMLLKLTHPESNVEYLSVRRNKVTGKGFRNMCFNTKLVYLAADNNEFGDIGCEFISKCRSLRRLYCRNCGMSEKGIFYLLNNKSLRKINTGYVEFAESVDYSDKYLRSIGKGKMLEILNLSSCGKLPHYFTNVLTQFKRLTRLHFISCSFDNQQIKLITGIKSVLVLSLYSCLLKERDFDLISRNKTIEELDIGENLVSDYDFSKFITKMKQLRYLDVTNNFVTDVVINYLPPNLRTFVISGTRISNWGFNALQSIVTEIQYGNKYFSSKNGITVLLELEGDD